VTAIPERRKRRTIVGAVTGFVLVSVAAGLFIVGAITLSNSQEGEAVGVDERPVVALPDTPNAMLAVTDNEGQLASVAIMTLLPEGQGGSIVTVPVNADGTVGFGEQRRPLTELFDADDPESILEPLEEMLTITIERSAVVGVDELVEILDPIESLQVVLPEDVVDSSQLGSGIVALAGPQTLRRLLVAQALAAVNDEGASYDHHAVDVELWTQLARTAPIKVPAEPVDVDEFGRPIPPDTVEELVMRLWEGDIEVRDIAVTEPLESANPTGADVVLVDRADAVLVFAQISPALVSTPNPAMSFRIEARYSDEQLEATGDLFESSSELVREMTRELLFFQANVISTDTVAAADGAPEITRIEVSDKRFIEDMELAGSIFFGESVVVVSSTVLDGVDAVVILGTGYLDLRELNDEGAVVVQDTVETDD
jgi:hypothetical protein